MPWRSYRDHRLCDVATLCTTRISYDVFERAAEERSKSTAISHSWSLQGNHHHFPHSPFFSTLILACQSFYLFPRRLSNTNLLCCAFICSIYLLTYISEVTSQSLWSRCDHHFVDITWIMCNVQLIGEDLLCYSNTI